MSFLKRANKIGWAVAALLVAVVPSYSSENTIILSDDVLLKVADAFRDEGEYYRAVTEYKRLLILFPDSDKADYAFFNIGISYYRGEEYGSAATMFSLLREKYSDSKYILPSHYFEGLSYRKLKKYEEAKSKLDVLVHMYPATEYAPRAIVAKSLIGLDEDNAAASKKELGRLIKDYPTDKTATDAREALQVLKDYERLPAKSTIMAGALSAVVPGSGYMYAGNYEDGLTAFLINTLFISGTITAIHQRNYTTAYLVGAFGLPFYAGNIYGSANAAKKWNVRVRQEQRKKVYATLELDL